MTNTTADGFAPCCGAPPKVTEWLPGCYGAQCMVCGGTVGDETQMDEGDLREAWNRAVSKIRQPGDRSERDITMAHHAVCTCGGSGPGEGCPACEMWHILYLANASNERRQKPPERKP